MRHAWKAACLAVIAVLAVTPAAAAPATPQTYDCQARITRPDPLPPIRAGRWPAWRCRTPKNTVHAPALHWVRDSLEYCRIATSAYAGALRAVYRAAVAHGPGHWVVLMDADETVLDNSLYMRERQACGEQFSEESWRSWIRAGAARDIPGAAGFTQTVHALGGYVAIVTNRDAAEDAVTRKNLAAAGIHFDYEIGRPKGTPSSKVVRWKGAVAALAKDGHAPTPVIWVGDQVTDFPILDEKGRIVRAMSEKDAGAGIGRRFFLIPNPVYGGWTSNPPN